MRQPAAARALRTARGRSGLKAGRILHSEPFRGELPHDQVKHPHWGALTKK